MKLLLHSQTSPVQPLKFGNGKVVSSHTILGMCLVILGGIKTNPYWLKVSQVSMINTKSPGSAMIYINRSVP